MVTGVLKKVASKKVGTSCHLLETKIFKIRIAADLPAILILKLFFMSFFFAFCLRSLILSAFFKFF